MKKLLILSGKGGTGKTTLAYFFIKLSEVKAYADCDVDAPNLHLVTNQNTTPKKSDYFGMGKAKINDILCLSCDLCRKNCKFDAIEKAKTSYKVNEFSCEGCGVCEAICPTNAIRIHEDVAGELTLFKDDKLFSTAELKMGSGTSGKLVSEVKKQLNEFHGIAEIAIIDGSPGIGCPVIASMTGVDLILIVAEPSLSGMSDMERIIETAKKFDVKTMVCVNKFDINMDNTNKIKQYCEKEKILFVGSIPFDKQIMNAVNNSKNIIDSNSMSMNSIKEVYKKTFEVLSEL